MKLVIEISGHHGGETLYRLVESFPVMVGRGYHNDIILSDPHVGEQHLRIDFDGAAWTLTDLGSINHTYINKRPVRATTAKLASGDTLVAGNMRLRIFLPRCARGAARQAAAGKPDRAGLEPPRRRVGAVRARIGRRRGMVLHEHLVGRHGAFARGGGRQRGRRHPRLGALWSVAGRLAGKRSFFMGHITLISLFVVLCVAVFFINTYVDFLTNENWIAAVTAYALNTTLLALLVYGSLSLSTTLKKRRRIFAGVFFACGLMAGLFAVDTLAAEKFNPDALYPYRIEPFLAQFAQAKTVDGFMAENKDLFKSETFSAAAKKAEPSDHP